MSTKRDRRRFTSSRRGRPNVRVGQGGTTANQYAAGAEPDRVTVVIADRDPAVRHLLERILAARQFEVTLVDEPLELTTALQNDDVDIGIVQIGGPLQFRPIRDLRAMPRHADTWILALLGPDDRWDLPQALEEGADHCMAKPISPREMLARLDAMHRRIRRQTPTVLRFDGLTIDLRTREVRVAGTTVDLPPREFNLLAYLARHPDEVVTRERLVAELWNSSSSWHPDETLTEHIHRLRRRIEADPVRPRWLHTARGVGYRFRT